MVQVDPSSGPLQEFRVDSGLDLFARSINLVCYTRNKKTF